jgi:hypothetical protein
LNSVIGSGYLYRFARRKSFHIIPLEIEKVE